MLSCISELAVLKFFFFDYTHIHISFPCGWWFYSFFSFYEIIWIAFLISSIWIISNCKSKKKAHYSAQLPTILSNCPLFISASWCKSKKKAFWWIKQKFRIMFGSYNYTVMDQWFIADHTWKSNISMEKVLQKHTIIKTEQSNQCLKIQ